MAEIKDWELSDDYFQAEDSAKELKLEDFMTEEPSEHDGSDGPFGSFGDTTDQILLQKTIQDVHEVLARAQKGDTIQEIAAELELDEQYVYNIQVSAQGFREDDEIAVAHLVMMG